MNFAVYFEQRGTNLVKFSKNISPETGLLLKKYSQI